MDIPLKVRIPICIEQGSVFNFYIDFGDIKRQSKNRYFVILNRNPKTDRVLVLVTSTTQVLKRRSYVNRAGISERTIVKVNASEYCVFKDDSAFNCNEVFEVSMTDLIRKIENGGSSCYPKIPETVLSKLIRGVKESPIVTEEIKSLL
jgi:hypothetical protein